MYILPKFLSFKEEGKEKAFNKEIQSSTKESSININIDILNNTNVLVNAH